MPVSLAFRFPAGRYHATPFGHHVNEGLIEWPPSPWRLLRALISVGYTSGAWNGAGPPAVVCGLIEKLSSDLPHYRVPPAVGTHTRHYMPIGVLDAKTKREKTTLVFDTWARLEDEELTITWCNTQLDKEELDSLCFLVERLNYLGRSESWVDGRVIGEDEPTPEGNCFPEQHGEVPGRGWEQIALLAAVDAGNFATWRTQQLGKVLADLPLPDGRKPTKSLLRKRAKASNLILVTCSPACRKIRLGYAHTDGASHPEVGASYIGANPTHLWLACREPGEQLHPRNESRPCFCPLPTLAAMTMRCRR